MKLGIVPAGGSALRFGGVYKELLPVANGKSALENCVEMLSFCDKVVVLTTPEKVGVHIGTLRRNPNVIFSVSDDTLWCSIALTFPLHASRSYFVMPDTYFKPIYFGGDGDFELMTFKTSTPKKYGVLVDGHIVDKRYAVGEFQAWGALSWSDKVIDLWKDKMYFTHTDALNDAIDHFGYKTYPMEFYYDFASMDDYKTWLTHI